ncbi:unnamed protein product [Plasmodium vivax]|uniref:(malaria parasite P. vivax) hypothetical protein n=1 Tax=Plasmodium vivax TaxID=5855 RepID=A0A8S4HGH9_PLAVI|nr:unnamed protein product [Plasmodium vivax]
MVPKVKLDEYEFFDHMDIGPIYKAVKYANNDSPLESNYGNKTLIECNNQNFNSADIRVCNKFNKLIRALCAIKSSSQVNNSLKNSD